MTRWDGTRRPSIAWAKLHEGQHGRCELLETRDLRREGGFAQHVKDGFGSGTNTFATGIHAQLATPIAIRKFVVMARPVEEP